MADIIKSGFESLSISEKETLVLNEGKLISRKEADGFVVFLYAFRNLYAKVCYYQRSHEVVVVELRNTQTPELENNLKY